MAARSRFAWCITGSGHFLEESIALAARLPGLDLFLSDAAEEVLPIYGQRVEDLRPRFGPGFRLVRDKTASAVPVGMLYDDVYHTVVIAPATSTHCTGTRSHQSRRVESATKLPRLASKPESGQRGRNGQVPLIARSST